MRPTHTAAKAFLATAGLLLVACGPPVLDTSSVSAFVESARAIEEALQADRREAFEDAFDHLTGDADLSAGPTNLEPVVAACARLDGMAAEEIIRTAWEDWVANTEERLTELEALRDETVETRRILQGVEIVKAQLFPPEPGYLDRAVVDIAFVNRTRRRLDEVAFEVSFRIRNQLEPWVVETVTRPFGAGLAPGREVEVRLELQDSAWDRLDRFGDRGVLACDVARIVGRGRRVIAASEYGAIDEYLIRALRQQLEDLRANPPRLGGTGETGAR